MAGTHCCTRNLDAASLKEQIIVRWHRQRVAAKPLRELRRISRVPEAEENAVSPIDLPETANAKFLAVLEAELHHRIQFVAEASFGYMELDKIRTGDDCRGQSSVQV
jgi:hypothetical protein